MLILFEVQQPTFGFPKRHILAVKEPTINSWEPGAAATWQKGAVNSTPLWDGFQWRYPNEWISWSFGHSNKKPIKTSFTKHQGLISPQRNSSEYTLIFLPVGMWVCLFALLSCCQKTIPNNSTPQEKLKGYIQNHSKINGTSWKKIPHLFFWGGGRGRGSASFQVLRCVCKSIGTKRIQPLWFPKSSKKLIINDWVDKGGEKLYRIEYIYI